MPTPLRSTSPFSDRSPSYSSPDTRRPRAHIAQRGATRRRVDTRLSNREPLRQLEVCHRRCAMAGISFSMLSPGCVVVCITTCLKSAEKAKPDTMEHLRCVVYNSLSGVPSSPSPTMQRMLYHMTRIWSSHSMCVLITYTCLYGVIVSCVHLGLLQCGYTPHMRM